MSSIWPTVWSAVAATFSAIAALVLMSVNLKNREDSVRPEVILDGWSFREDPPPGWGIIRITKDSERRQRTGALHERSDESLRTERQSRRIPRHDPKP